MTGAGPARRVLWHGIGVDDNGSRRIGVVGLVKSVNVGVLREVEREGRPTETAIWKTPVSGRVRVRGVNLDGDDQADRNVHGGPDKAVYAYAVEDARWWETELDRALDVGAFGENLTIEGIDITGAVVGERWQVGTVLLEVSAPRVPCWKLNLRMGDSTFVRRFAAAGRPGAYLRIVTEGDVGAGDEICIVSVPAHGPTVGDVAHAGGTPPAPRR